jgi:hypothetical protein
MYSSNGNILIFVSDYGSENMRPASSKYDLLRNSLQIECSPHKHDMRGHCGRPEESRKYVRKPIK